MKPSTLASGVRSSWETMFTSSVFIRSLSRSSSFWASSSLRPSSQPLRHRVERLRQLADLSGPFRRQPQRELAARDPVRARRRRPDRASDRACEHDPEERDQRHRRQDRDGADEHGEIGAPVRRRLRPSTTSVFSTARKLPEEAPDLVRLHLAVLRQAGVLVEAGLLAQQRDQRRDEVVHVRPDPRHQHLRPRPLGRSRRRRPPAAGAGARAAPGARSRTTRASSSGP